jgi:hypothetical protein
MTLSIGSQLSGKLQLIVHCIGLSCLGGAIFLQILVFSNILGQGYFRAVETNPSILGVEVFLTAFTAVYFIYLYQKTICSHLKEPNQQTTQ